MAISASQIVKVTPRVISAGASELQTVGMILTPHKLCPYPNTLTFSTTSAVGAWFGTDSDEYAAAVKYFLGYNNSFKKPKTIHFGRWVTSAISGTYIGTGAVSSLTTLKTITSGKCVFNIDNTERACINVDLSEAASMADVAQALQTALNSSATVTYDTNLAAFVVTSASTGSTSSVVFVSDGGGDESQYFTEKNRYSLTSEKTTAGYGIDETGIYQGSGSSKTTVATWSVVNSTWDTYSSWFEIDTEGAVRRYKWYTEYVIAYNSEPTVTTQALASNMGLASGTKWSGAASLADDAASNMDAIINVDANWVSFTTITEASKTVATQLAEWVNGTSAEYLYCAYTTQSEDKDPTSTTNLATIMKSYEGVVLTYGGLDYAILVMTIGACIDWERVNGLVTYAFKTQDGLEATIDNDTDATNCESMGVNFYGNYKARSDEFIWYYQGKMSGGSFGFVDAYIGQLWLRNVLQVAILNGLGAVGRVPYNDEGYSTIRAWCQDPINRALKNGVIDAGVSLSESQKATLYSEIGSDVSNTIFTNGYYLLIEDPSTNVRAERGTPVMGIWYSYAGSVHHIDVPVSAVL